MPVDRSTCVSVMSFNGYPKTLSNLYKTYIEYSEKKMGGWRWPLH